MDQIERQWSGTFGDFNVLTKVVEGDANTIYLINDYADVAGRF
jgi:hypothetical protein